MFLLFGDLRWEDRKRVNTIYPSYLEYLCWSSLLHCCGPAFIPIPSQANQNSLCFFDVSTSNRLTGWDFFSVVFGSRPEKSEMWEVLEGIWPAVVIISCTVLEDWPLQVRQSWMTSDRKISRSAWGKQKPGCFSKPFFDIISCCYLIEISTDFSHKL